jgi:TolA-binding protein
MTYAELGEAIDRSEVAARAMAMRKRWKRVLGNDGRARVAVPIELVERLKAKAEARALAQPDTRADGQPDTSANTPPDGDADARALIAVLETRIGELQGRVSELTEEVKDNRATIAELTTKAGRVDVAEALLDTERQRVEEWKAVADRFASQAETLAEAAQARHGWWSWRRAS